MPEWYCRDNSSSNAGTRVTERGGGVSVNAKFPDLDQDEAFSDIFYETTESILVEEEIGEHTDVYQIQQVHLFVYWLRTWSLSDEPGARENLRVCDKNKSVSRCLHMCKKTKTNVFSRADLFGFAVISRSRTLTDEVKILLEQRHFTEYLGTGRKIYMSNDLGSGRLGCDKSPHISEAPITLPRARGTNPDGGPDQSDSVFSGFEKLSHDGGCPRGRGCLRWRHVWRILIWRARRLSGHWPEVSRRTAVAMWKRWRAASAYAPTLALTYVLTGTYPISIMTGFQAVRLSHLILSSSLVVDIDLITTLEFEFTPHIQRCISR